MLNTGQLTLLRSPSIASWIAQNSTVSRDSRGLNWNLHGVRACLKMQHFPFKQIKMFQSHQTRILHLGSPKQTHTCLGWAAAHSDRFSRKLKMLHRLGQCPRPSPCRANMQYTARLRDITLLLFFPRPRS